MASTILPTLKKLNVGIAVDPPRRGCDKTSSSELGGSVHDNMGIDGDRKVSKETGGDVEPLPDMTTCCQMEWWICFFFDPMHTRRFCLIPGFEIQVEQYSTNIMRSFLRL